MMMDFGQLRILVVEDVPFTREIVRGYLRSAGVQAIREAGDGQAALRELDAGFRPDLILCDVNMQPLHGLAFIRRLRASADTARASLPVILLTLDADEPTVREAAQLRVAGYLAKPISRKLLLDRITAVMASQSART